MRIIKLKSSDGDIFEADLHVAKCSGTIKTMLEEFGVDGDDEEKGIVPLPNVNSAILHRVLQWAIHHKNDSTSTDGNPTDGSDNAASRANDISPWDLEFVNVDQGTLFQIMVAANYLHIEGLLELTTKVIANMFKGKTPEQIRSMFNISNDLHAEKVE